MRVFAARERAANSVSLSRCVVRRSNRVPRRMGEMREVVEWQGLFAENESLSCVRPETAATNPRVVRLSQSKKLPASEVMEGNRRVGNSVETAGSATAMLG